MEDISNKTLAILVIIAIIVSMTALFVVVGKFRIIKTGMAGTFTEGNISLEILTDIDISATDSEISFGNMLPQQWNNSEIAGDNITVQVMGVTVVDIDYWSNSSMFDSKNESSGYDSILPTERNRQESGNEGYRIKILDNTNLGVGSICQDYNDTNFVTGGWCNPAATYYDVCTTGGWCDYDAVCVSDTIYENVSIRENVTSSNGDDDELRHLIGYCPQNAQITIGIAVHVPESEPASVKSSWLNFRAQQYGSYND